MRKVHAVAAIALGAIASFQIASFGIAEAQSGKPTVEATKALPQAKEEWFGRAIDHILSGKVRPVDQNAIGEGRSESRSPQR